MTKGESLRAHPTEGACEALTTARLNGVVIVTGNPYYMTHYAARVVGPDSRRRRAPTE
jgi:hypothetical protein